MANRVNAFVNSHPALKTHLSAFPEARAERLKLLASLGAILGCLENESVLVEPGHDAEWNGRINIRLSEAHAELSAALKSTGSSQSGTLVELAARGLDCITGGKRELAELLGLRSEAPSAHDPSMRHVTSPATMKGKSAEVPSNSSTVALTARLAGDLIKDDDDAIWSS